MTGDSRIFIRTALAFIVLSLGFGQAPAAADADRAYPTAKRLPIVDEMHGMKIADPYRWMEDASDPDLAVWLEMEAVLTDEFVAGQRFEAARRRIETLGTFDLAFAARRRGDRLFHMARLAGDGSVVLRAREGDDARTLLAAADIPEPAADGIRLGGTGFAPAYWPDRNGRMLVYGYTSGAASRWQWRIFDTNAGKHLPEVLDEVNVAFGDPAWSATGDGFYYFRVRAAEAEATGETRNEPVGLFFHKLGTSQADDTALIEQTPGDRHVYEPHVTDDGRRVVVTRREGTAPRSDFLVFDARDPGAFPLRLLEQADARSIYLGNNGTRLFFQTTLDAPNGRVIAIDLDAPGSVVDIVPETGLPMLAGSNVGGDIVGYFGGYLVLGYLRDGLAEVRIFDREGRFRTTLAIPAGSSIWGSLDSVPGTARFTASLLNPFVPGQLVEVDAGDGSIRTALASANTVDAEAYTVERVFYDSADGTRIPMSVVHRKDLELDGKNPALIYGYGMHRWVSLLFYQAHILHWLELGGVYAMPAIRGGGEYGDSWHEAGIKTNRQNAVDDFVAAGRWLIEQGYTSPDRLVANGGSASGALAGMVAVRYGDLFAAATVDYPVADLVRAPLFGNGALLVDEYGSLDDAEEARAMISQSPYQQAAVAKCYVPTLIMVGEADKVALPFHGYKLAAAFQHGQRCDNPVLLKVMPETGHNFGLSPQRFAENAAVQIAFLRRVLDF